MQNEAKKKFLILRQEADLYLFPKVFETHKYEIKFFEFLSFQANVGC